jgi:hypothetical protein
MVRQKQRLTPGGKHPVKVHFPTLVAERMLAEARARSVSFGTIVVEIIEDHYRKGDVRRDKDLRRRARSSIHAGG